MNIYVVVEGLTTEKQVYQSWIPYVNPELKVINHVSEFSVNKFLVVAGGGYPNYNQIIKNAIEDINTLQNIDRLVIAVDSEEMTYEEKYHEIFNLVSNEPCQAQIRIIIQHFCFEAWALGNRKIMGRNVQDRKLLGYKRFYDVLSRDPELLPSYPLEELTRARFAVKYLNLAFHEKYHQLAYSKSRPKALLNENYFLQLKRRLIETQHIKSFNAFLDAFT